MQDVSVVAETLQVTNFAGGDQASVSVAVASGTTVPVNSRIVKVSASASTTSTTLAAGTLDGQTIVVINESANQVIITGNTKTTVTIAASSAVQYVWSAGDTLWWHTT